MSMPFRIGRSLLAQRSSLAFPRSSRWRSPAQSTAFLSRTSDREPSKQQPPASESPGLVEQVLQWIPTMPADKQQDTLQEDDPDFHTTTLDWTNRIRRLIREDNNIHEADATLTKAVRILGSSCDHDQWIRSERLNLLDAWVEHQSSLLDRLNSDFEERTSSRLSREEKRQIASERKSLVRDIAAAAESAHNLLEWIEPFLGARPIVQKTADDDDVNNNSNMNESKSKRPVVDDSILSACHAVLRAWTRAVRADPQHRVVRGAPQRAQFLHDRMQQSTLSSSSPTSYPPCTESYKRVLQVWAYSGENLRAAAADRVYRERVAKLDAAVDVETYRLIMTAFALSEERGSAYQATSYLKKMMLVVSNDGDESSSSPHDSTVTVEDYHMALEAWTRSEEKSAAYKAMQLVKYLEESQTVSPDMACYRWVLQTIARKSEQASFGELADETLQKMREAYMVPDSLCFTCAIKTWKNAALLEEATVAEKETSVQRTLELLSEMDVAHNQSTSLDVLVSTENVNDVLQALSVSDNPRRTELANTLLTRMEGEIDDRNFRLMPDSKSYMYAIRIWKSVWSLTRVQEAKSILDRMVDRFDVVSRKSARRNESVAVFNAFIQVCSTQRVSSATEGLALLHEATNAVQRIRRLNSSKLVPDASTYTVLLQACVNVLDETSQRSTLVKKIFAQCCVEGMVDEGVLQALKSAISSELYSDLVIARSEEIDGVKLVPEAWSVRALRGSTITADGRRTVPLGIDGRLTYTRGMLEFQMRRLREKRNQRLLRGGRLQTSSKEERSWVLY